MSHWSRNLSVTGDREIKTILGLSFGFSLGLSLLWLIPKASCRSSPVQKQGKRLLKLYHPDMCSNMSKKGQVQYLPEDACSLGYKRILHTVHSKASSPPDSTGSAPSFITTLAL